MPTRIIAVLFILLFNLVAAAQSLKPTAAQAALIRKIEGRLMAPCCYTQTIFDHQSEVAAQMRDQVTAMVASGKSETDIINYYRKAYGETILVVPDGVSGGLLTCIPLLLFVASTGLLFFAIRRSGINREAAKAVLQIEPDATPSALRETIRRETGGYL